MIATTADVESADAVESLDVVASWDAIAMGFTHMHRRLHAAIEAEGLPGPSFEALRLLLASDGHRMPMSRLARDLTMTAGGLTKLADRLARDGLIDRRNSSDDRRVVYAALTEKGAEIATRTLEIYRASLREKVLGVLSPDRLADLANVMRMLDAYHDDGTDGPALIGDAEHTDAALLTTRDPALPERRARARD
jgi:DNA-binding MarR family transcriptional regulator